ncbi:hypothetical protein V8E36_006526 [Tilletia maclaganii]
MTGAAQQAANAEQNINEQINDGAPQQQQEDPVNRIQLNPQQRQSTRGYQITSPRDTPPGSRPPSPHQHSGDEEVEYVNLNPTADQRREAETFYTSRDRWFNEIPAQFSKKQRGDITRLTVSVIFASDRSAHAAFNLAVHQMARQSQIEELLGQQMNPSSDPPQPENIADQGENKAHILLKKGKGKEVAPSEKRKRTKSSGDEDPPKSRRSKKHKKGRKPRRTRIQSSSDDGSSPPSSSSSSSSSDGSDSSDDTSSDSGSSRSGDDTKWKRGRKNPVLWGKLNIPDHVAKKVDKGAYVDMWYFTSKALSTKTEARRRTVELRAGGLVAAKDPKPTGFVEDEDLPFEDFLQAVYKWSETMKAEDIGPKTRRAWQAFNDTVRRHPQRHKPTIQKALKVLHQHQRRTFAHETRQTKAKRKRIKGDDELIDKKKQKKLDKLLKFDPAVFPEDSFTKIQEALEEQRVNDLETSIKQLQASGSGPAVQRKSTGEASSLSTKTKAGGTSGSKLSKRRDSGVNRTFQRCGSRARHDPRACNARSLAADPNKPTFVTKNSEGHVVKRSDGKTRICTSYNGNGCTFALCSHAHIYSLCGNATCNTQRCRLATNAAAQSAAPQP